MGLIVQKFGGSSVADAQKVFNVANRVIETYDQGNDVVVVVSAQGDTTDDLIAHRKEKWMFSFLQESRFQCRFLRWLLKSSADL